VRLLSFFGLTIDGLGLLYRQHVTHAKEFQSIASCC